MRTLSQNEQRRLTALIAAPLKEEGAAPEIARPTISSAVREFTNVYRKVYGITITAQQADEIRTEAAEKLG